MQIKYNLYQLNLLVKCWKKLLNKCCFINKHNAIAETALLHLKFANCKNGNA